MNHAFKKQLSLTVLSAAAFAAPLVSSAQTTVKNVSDVGTFIINLINNVAVPVVFALAFIVFVWGAFTAFILGAQSGEAQKSGKNLMLYGLIGFFVMASVWGLVNILTGTITFGNPNSVNFPTTQGVKQ
jgi:hypothetical protein